MRSLQCRLGRHRWSPHGLTARGGKWLDFDLHCLRCGARRGATYGLPTIVNGEQRKRPGLPRGEDRDA